MARSSIKLFMYAVMLSALTLSFLLVKPVAAETSELIFSAPWGDKPGEMGLINQPEQEICGPLSFCTDGRNVFVLDTVNSRIVGIDANGEAKVIASKVVGWGICTDGSGGVFVQDGKRIMHIDGSGKVKSRFTVEEKSGALPKLVEGYGMDMFQDSAGYLCVRGLDQKAHRISDAPRMRTPSSSSPATSATSLHYKIKRFSGNEVRILGLDPDGKVLVSVPVRFDGGEPGAVLFKGTNAEANLYVEVEHLKGNKVELKVHCYSPSGKRLGVLHLPNDYFTTVYKKTELARDGSVYQMLTTPEEVRILRWEF